MAMYEKDEKETIAGEREEAEGFVPPEPAQEMRETQVMQEDEHTPTEAPAAAPPPIQPAQQPRQYWSAPERNQAYGEPPPPWQNGYQGGYRSDSSSPYVPQNDTYPYNANRGWQPPQQQGYQWNFEEYERFGQTPGKKHKRSGLVVFAVSLLCVLSVALVALSGYSIWQSMTFEEDKSDYFRPEQSQPGEQEGSVPTTPPNPDADQLQIWGRPQTDNPQTEGDRMTIPQVAKAVGPSVVGVVQYMNTLFFEPAGVGSGIILTEDGYIITNAHVVRGADAIKVVLDNGEPYEATVVGEDMRTDLAVIKIEATGLTPAQFGDSDALEVGETVIAIGNPTGMDLSGTVTKGIVSALNREVKTTDYSMSFIQTDAAINPGNSGGALVNEFGQVVGINSAKIIEEGYEGIGFAIPITGAKPIIDDLMRNGRVTGRVVLGITATTIDEATAKTYDVPMGLQIIEIQNEDMINQGVQSRDIITEIGGVRIYSLEDVRSALEGHKAGDSISLKIFRQVRLTQSTTFTVEITLMEDKG